MKKRLGELEDREEIRELTHRYMQAMLKIFQPDHISGVRWDVAKFHPVENKYFLKHLK